MLVAGAPRRTQALSPALRGGLRLITITPTIILYQSSEIAVTPKAGRNALCGSDTPEIDASKFTLHILSDTPGGSQRLKYIR